MKNSPVLEIWIDGQCALCRRSEQWCSSRDPLGRMVFVDLRVPVNENPPGSPEAMVDAVHLRLPNGAVITGFDAWRRILMELDGWRWLARLAGLPGIRKLGPAVYSFLARHRHRIPIN